MMSPPKTNLQAFLKIVHYLIKFSPSSTDVYESLRQLTSGKTEWTWNATYKKLFDKAKSIITEDSCMKFYDETQPLYLETDASGIGLRTSLLHNRSGTSCQRNKAPDNSILRPLHLQARACHLQKEGTETWKERH